MFTKFSKEKEVKKEVKEGSATTIAPWCKSIQEVKPASWLEVKMEVKHSVPDDTTRPQTIVHEQSSFTPTNRQVDEVNVSELTPTLTPHLTPHLNPSFSFHTELCVDLKTILTSDRKAKRFKDYRGVLTRDGREHFTFMEEAPERKATKHNPCVYKGYTINVHRRDDGIIYPTFRQPQYTRYYTFKDFCREAAEELLLVVSLLENEE